ncbi:signal recognition particle-docking protein FtsY [archaeon]|jgi:fused signal recognition particle receptor|nr:signal recognition particle-docking protein FtsY [archaeon]MBT4417185.1 signal recognition particle-docking protein FtsY [archaeon]
MFGFLKKKIKSAVSSITKKVEEEAEVVETPVKVEKKKPVIKEKSKAEKKVSKPKEEKKVEQKPKEKIIVKEEPVKEKKGFFGKIKERVTTKKISEKQFDEFFFELEVALLENNVALEVIDKIKEDLKVDLVDVPLQRKDVSKQIMDTLKKSVSEILDVPKISLLSEVKKAEKPYKILFLGFNGVGKSLSVARVAQYFKKNGLKPILAAGDTFRAAAVAQLEEYGKQVGVPVVKHQQGSDACAVIFDTISSAKAKSMDVVLADSAGRIHSNNDLMQELQKIVKKNKFDLKVLVIEATVGSDVVDQVKEFDKIVGVDALIITKNDVYEKGGSLLSACFLLEKPILFLGVGQGFDDLKEYDSVEVAGKMFE